MTVTFCGHRDVAQTENVRIWLWCTVEHLIAEGADFFYLGGYGHFDTIAASVVWKLKKLYPHIQSVLVLPYLDRKVMLGCYDYTIYPPLETVPKKFAISLRNRWMVEHSDVIVAYVLHSWGGAASTLKYAEQKKKAIIRFQEQSGIVEIR